MDIEKIITELLYHYDTVTIPGFGGLVLQQHSAASDQALGTIQPPSKRIRFNPNLVVNDGLLLSQVQERLQLPVEAAKSVLENYVSELKDRLEAGENIHMEGIGHFFQSGNEIQFAAAQVNYDRTTYGLPRVEAAVSNKIGTEKITFASITTETVETSNPTTRDYGNVLKWLIPVLGVLALIVIIFSLRDNIFSGNKKGRLRADLEGRIPINESPQERDKIIKEDSLAAQSETPKDIESPTISPNQKTKKIIVGAFGERANAEKLARKIQLAGYTPLSEIRNGKRYVGILYAYEQKSEFDQAFSDIKQKFNQDAWILTE
ncbi:MAG: SPOR domain-containing protein [Bacteroidota bacterium]